MGAIWNLFGIAASFTWGLALLNDHWHWWQLDYSDLLSYPLSDFWFGSCVVSNCFLERGPRSGLLYMFRRGLPILTFRTSEESVEPRAALCLHPLAYYESTHAGALPPSDELLALLLMMRADEPYLWRKANQLNIRDPMVAV